MRNAAAVACILSLAVSPVVAQSRAGSETINVVLIEVPVTVVDRDGNPVRGLTKENFEVFDGGQRREVTHFEVVDFGNLPLQRLDTSAAARRNFLLLFDLNHSTPKSLERAREAARSFITAQTTPYDRVSVATMSLQNGFRLLTSFTTDRDIASLAVDTLGVPKYFQINDPLLLTVSDLERMSQEAKARLNERLAEDLQIFAAMTKRAANENARQNITRYMEQVEELGRVLDRVSGRKQVILLSEGFEARHVAGREAESFSSQENKLEQALIERGLSYMVDTDNRYGNTQAAGSLRDMLDSLRRSDVVLHAVDIKGLRSDVDAAAGAQRVSNESLSLMTRETGGTVFKNANDLAAEFARMLKAQEVTYILGFQVPANNPGKFHELRVKLNDVPAARAAHRVGYYEPSLASNVIDRTLSAGEIIMNRLAVDEVKVRALAAPVPRGDGTTEVPVILEIDGPSLLKGVKGEEIVAEVFMYAFDPQEVIRDFVFQRTAFDLTKLRTRLSNRGVKFYHTLRLQPGEYSIRTLVRTVGGRSGSQHVAVTVPGFRDRVVMNPLIFDDTSEWVMVKAPDRQGADPYPFMAGEEMYVPAANAVLSPGESYNVALVTYNVPMNLNVQATIEGSGASVPAPMSLLGRTNPTAEGRVTTVLQMKPPKLARGPYSLVLLVREQESGTENRVSIPFQIP